MSDKVVTKNTSGGLSTTTIGLGVIGTCAVTGGLTYFIKAQNEVKSKLSNIEDNLTVIKGELDNVKIKTSRNDDNIGKIANSIPKIQRMIASVKEQNSMLFERCSHEDRRVSQLVQIVKNLIQHLNSKDVVKMDEFRNIEFLGQQFGGNMNQQGMYRSEPQQFGGNMNQQYNNMNQQGMYRTEPQQFGGNMNQQPNMNQQGMYRTEPNFLQQPHMNRQEPPNVGRQNDESDYKSIIDQL